MIILELKASQLVSKITDEENSENQRQLCHSWTITPCTGYRWYAAGPHCPGWRPAWRSVAGRHFHPPSPRRAHTEQGWQSAPATKHPWRPAADSAGRVFSPGLRDLEDEAFHFHFRWGRTAPDEEEVMMRAKSTLMCKSLPPTRLGGKGRSLVCCLIYNVSLNLLKPSISHCFDSAHTKLTPGLLLGLWDCFSSGGDCGHQVLIVLMMFTMITLSTEEAEDNYLSLI